METISYTAARSKLKETMDRVTQDHTPVLITRQNASPVVMLSQEDYNSIMETLYLLKSPANATRLIAAIEDIEKGEVTERELEE